MMDKVRKVWRILVWVALALVVVLGAAAFWLYRWAMRGYEDSQRMIQQASELQRACAQQLQQQTRISGRLDESAKTGTGSYYASQQGQGPMLWNLAGVLLNSAGKRRFFECKVQQQVGKFTVLDVHFTPQP